MNIIMNINMNISKYIKHDLLLCLDYSEHKLSKVSSQ